MRFNTLYILFSFFLVFTANAQTVEINQRCKQAYTDIIALKFDDAQKLLTAEKKSNPDNLYVNYLENYIDFLTLFIDENEDYFCQIEEREDDRLDLLDNLPDNNPYKNYLKANIRLQWAIAGLKFQNYFSSALDIRRSYLLIKKNSQTFTDFKPQLITKGVLHIIIGMVPDQYSWILSLISLEGSVPQGEEELSTAFRIVQNNQGLNYLEPEVLFYLGFMEMNLGLDESRKQMLLEQLSPYTEYNLMLTFLKANMLARSARNDEALQLLENTTHRTGYHPFYYLWYLKGEYKLRKLDTDAGKDYQYFTLRFKGINFIKDAWRKTGWSFLLKGDTAAYRNIMKKVLTVGETNVGADKDADKEAGSKKIPDITLLKARLLSDGGYYNRARNILQKEDLSHFNAEENLERLYRLGRIEQKSGNIDACKHYFKQTIEWGKNSKRYFAGNAALQLGNIYESEKNFTQAIKYYNLCRSLSFDEYETGIKEKAKQGIKRIEEEK